MPQQYLVCWQFTHGPLSSIHHPPYSSPSLLPFMPVVANSLWCPPMYSSYWLYDTISRSHTTLNDANEMLTNIQRILRCVPPKRSITFTILDYTQLGWQPHCLLHPPIPLSAHCLITFWPIWKGAAAQCMVRNPRYVHIYHWGPGATSSW